MANATGVGLQQARSPPRPPSTVRAAAMRVKTIVFKLMRLRSEERAANVSSDLLEMQRGENACGASIHAAEEPANPIRRFTPTRCARARRGPTKSCAWGL